METSREPGIFLFHYILSSAFFVSKESRMKETIRTARAGQVLTLAR